MKFQIFKFKGILDLTILKFRKCPKLHDCPLDMEEEEEINFIGAVLCEIEFNVLRNVSLGIFLITL